MSALTAKTRDTRNANHKVIWDMNIPCCCVIMERKSDIVIVYKMEKAAIFIDFAISGDKRIIDNEKKKLLKREIQRL